MAKKKATRKTNRTRRQGRQFTPLELRQVERWVSQFYIWRYINEKTGIKVDEERFRGFVDKHKEWHIKLVAKKLSFHWQAITISYCEDNWGKQYRLFGFARTPQKIVADQDGILPVITAAMKGAEDNANEKHIYARAVIVAPWTRAFPELLPILRMRKDDLDLYDQDLVDIQGVVNDTVTTYLYDVEETEDLDRQIANLLS